MDYLPFGEQIGGSTASTHKFTGKERDGESGLDNFGARYDSSSMGRFMSPDPVFFQASMSADPQQFNLYSYVRNSPLSLIDPTGEAIELTCNVQNTDECTQQRQKQLQALRSTVGEKAGSYLYENKLTVSDGTTKYYVGIYTNGPDGKGPSFGTINSAASAIGGIINDRRVAVLDLVPSGSYVTNSQGQNERIAPIGDLGTPGATYTGRDGKIHVTLLDTTGTSPGTLPPDFMSDGRPGLVDAGILAGHEFGHVRYEWSNWFGRAISGGTNSSAIRLENSVRKARGSNAPTRTRHN